MASSTELRLSESETWKIFDVLLKKLISNFDQIQSGTDLCTHIGVDSQIRSEQCQEFESLYFCPPCRRKTLPQRLNTDKVSIFFIMKSEWIIPGEVIARRTRWPTYFLEWFGGPTMKVTSVNDLLCSRLEARETRRSQSPLICSKVIEWRTVWESQSQWSRR